jgi:hypothetical protein
MSSKSQNVNFSRVKAKDIRINQEMDTGDKKTSPTSKEEFVDSVRQLINQLERVSSEHPDITDAISELRSLLQETQKSNPEPTVIKRFLASAKGLLVDAAESVTAVGTISTGITILISAIKLLFGT